MWPVMAKNLTLKQQKFLELRLEKGLKGAEAYRQAYGSANRSGHGWRKLVGSAEERKPAKKARATLGRQR